MKDPYVASIKNIGPTSATVTPAMFHKLQQQWLRTGEPVKIIPTIWYTLPTKTSNYCV